MLADKDRIFTNLYGMGDRSLALEQLGRLMGQCVACHETYQIREITSDSDR